MNNNNIETPKLLNDISDVDMSKLQYTSDILENMKKDGVYDSLCGLIRAVKVADKSDSFLVSQIKKRFNTYCGNLSMTTFKRWLNGEYREINESYHFGRDVALGELLAIGMNVARKNSDTIEGGEYALKLLDRLDNGLVSHKNKPVEEVNGSAVSNETSKTLGKLMVDLNSVEEPEDEYNE